jgi:hypothetical protein
VTLADGVWVPSIAHTDHTDSFVQVLWCRASVRLSQRFVPGGSV